MNAINKTKNTKNMYEGIMALYQYYTKIFLKRSIDFDIENKETVRYAMVANCILNLIFSKEEIVENKGCLNYESKIYEEQLEENILMIAKKCDEGYKIDDYIAKTPASLLSSIRNSIAHGSFEIIGNDIVLIKGDKKIKINIDKLALLTYKLTVCVRMLEVKDVYNRYLSLTPLPLDLQDFVDGKSDYRLIEMEFKRQDNLDLTIEDKREIEQFFSEFPDQVNSCFYEETTEQPADILTRNFEILKLPLELKGINVKMKLDALTEEELSIAKIRARFYLERNIPSQLFINYLNDLKHQDYYTERAIVQGCNYNYAILNQMKKMNCKNCSIENVFKELYSSPTKQTPYPLRFLDSFDIIMVTTLLSAIVVLYGYPLDDLYTDENNLNGLDFSELDLSKFNPVINEYKTCEVDIRKKEYESIIKELEIILKKINNKEEQISKVTDIEILNKIKQDLFDISNKYEELVIEGFNRQERYSNIKEEYETKQDYYNKKNIIEGIRNSIAHGNVTINKFVNSTKLGDLEIRFVNEHNGIVWFDAIIKLSDLETLISRENIEYIFNFCENKKTR